MTLITGNTYPVKEALKALGGKWDAKEKGWRVPDDKADEARALVAAAPKLPWRSTEARRDYAAAQRQKSGVRSPVQFSYWDSEGNFVQGDDD